MEILVGRNGNLIWVCQKFFENKYDPSGHGNNNNSHHKSICGYISNFEIFHPQILKVDYLENSWDLKLGYVDVIDVILFKECSNTSNWSFSNVRTHPYKNSSCPQILKNLIFSKNHIFNVPTNQYMDELLWRTHTWKFFYWNVWILKNIFNIYHMIIT